MGTQCIAEDKLRICIDCKTEKEISCFDKDKRFKDLLSKQCSACRLEKMKKSRKAARDGWSKRNREWRKQYEKCYNKQYYARNKEKLRDYCREYRKANNSLFKEWWQKNKLLAHEYGRRQRAEIQYSYLKILLKLRGFSRKQVEDNPELLEIVKINLQIQRQCKKLQNTLQN